MDGVAPLLCAGITLYSPIKHWNVKAGMKVAVMGLGGLGHMGVKFAVAMGADLKFVDQNIVLRMWTKENKQKTCNNRPSKGLMPI